MTMSSADFLDEWFETDVLKATKSASGIIGTFLGPRSPGTAYVLLHHYMGELDGVFRAWGFAKGGTGALSESIASAARACGAEIRCDAGVAKVLLRGRRATGVVLENGDEIAASIVASSLDPRRTFLQLLEPNHLPPDFVSDIKRFKFRGSSGKVNLALDGLPTFTCMPDGAGRKLHRGAVSISPSLDYVEHAYDDAKYGEFSRRPYMDIVFPSMIDPGMAPPGKHVMSIFVQYAPYHLNGGWTDAKREAFGDAVVNTVESFAPGFKSKILHRQVITPLDIEKITGLSEGNIFAGELALHQLFFLRPAPGWAKFATPVRGFYQAGSGTQACPGRGAASGGGSVGRYRLDPRCGDARSSPRRLRSAHRGARSLDHGAASSRWDARAAARHRAIDRSDPSHQSRRCGEVAGILPADALARRRARAAVSRAASRHRVERCPRVDAHRRARPVRPAPRQADGHRPRTHSADVDRRAARRLVRERRSEGIARRARRLAPEAGTALGWHGVQLFASSCRQPHRRLPAGPVEHHPGAVQAVGRRSTARRACHGPREER